VSDFRTNFHAYSRHYGIGWLHKPIVAYLRKFHNQTQRTMVPTDALRRELQGLGFDNLSVVARGVDTQHYSPAWRSEPLRQAWGVGADTLVVLCVGRIAAEKNLGTLRDAFLAIRAAGHDAKLVMVGDGPERATLQASWPDAHFAGIQRGEALAAHYASADLFVFPSLTETFGNVVIEAMASGLPLVAYDHAAAAELVRDGSNGLTAPVGDRARFIARVREAAADEPLRAALAVDARHTAKQNDWDRVIDELEYVIVGAILDRSLGSRPFVLRPVTG